MEEAALRSAIDRGCGYFLRSQYAKGYWMGELESNATITAEYLFFRRLLGRVDPERERAIVRQLLLSQVDGGWPLYYGGPPDLNTTIEAAVALQLGGVPANNPALVAANEVVRAGGGLEQARVFTRVWLALLGALSWGEVPAMPPELILLSRSFPLSIYRFASWARSTIVPLLIVLSRPIPYGGPVPRVQELYAGEERPRPARQFNRRAALAALNRLLKRTDGLLERNPLRRPALDRARRWLLEHQEADGGWGGIIPAMVNSTLALSVCPGEEQAVDRGIAAVDGFGLAEDGRFRLQSCISPGWDTPWVLLALAEAGLPGGHPALLRAGRWLLGQQSTCSGDWCLQAPGVPAGGWPFEFHNAHYPDTDDTALVIQALARVDLPSASARSTGLAWLVGMQNADGGWAAFDRANDDDLVEQIPFCDFGEVLDPSSADVTAHILETLARAGYGLDDPTVQRGLAYLRREQEPDGSWFGRWGVNYIYGTSAVLLALAALGLVEKSASVARAVHWLRKHQNEDGGWGESCRSYAERDWRGRGPSTASQTAWALLGLLATTGPGDPSIRAGLSWLLDHQKEDGAWEEPYFTGTGFPNDFYLKYHEYRNYFSLLALARAAGMGVDRPS